MPDSQAANQRYATALSTAHDARSVGELIHKLSKPTTIGGRRMRALRLWAPEDLALFSATSNCAFELNGFRNRDLVVCLYPARASTKVDNRRLTARVCRLLRLLRADSRGVKIVARREILEPSSLVVHMRGLEGACFVGALPLPRS